MVDHTSHGERELLAEALDVDPSAVLIRTREPLGAGSVTGADVAGGGEARYYVDTSELPIAGEARSHSESARIWLHPADPHLPALAPVAFDGAARTLLARLTVTAVGPPVFAAYRPGRRAVLHVPTATGKIWLKVVRPRRVREIVDAHAAALDAGIPVPALIGWSQTGLIVMADATGRAATDLDGAPEALLDEIDRLRTALTAIDHPRTVRGAASRLDWYAARTSGEGARVLSKVRASLLEATETPRPVVVVHGDLHLGQLFVDERMRISAVIDVDTMGLGDSAEDTSAFIAHAVASALLVDPGRRARYRSLADAAIRRWGDDTMTRALTALHLMGHALAAQDEGRADEAHLAAAEAVLVGSAPAWTDPKDALIDLFDRA